jgi:hypothetical protein
VQSVHNFWAESNGMSYFFSPRCGNNLYCCILQISNKIIVIPSPAGVRYKDSWILLRLCSGWLACRTTACAEMTDEQYISKKLHVPLRLRFASRDDLCAVLIRRSVELEDSNLLRCCQWNASVINF